MCERRPNEECVRVHVYVRSRRCLLICAVSFIATAASFVHVLPVFCRRRDTFQCMRTLCGAQETTKSAANAMAAQQGRHNRRQYVNT